MDSMINLFLKHFHGIINFYMNDDFNELFGNDEYNFKDTYQLLKN